MPPFSQFFHFLVQYRPILRSICMQNLRFASSDVPEILGGPKIWKLGHITEATPLPATLSCVVSPTVNQHAKFEVCIFSHSRDIRGGSHSQIRKVGHVTDVQWAMPPFDQFFIYWFIIHYHQSACKTWGLYLEPVRRYFSFFDLVSVTFNPHAKFEVCIFSLSIDIREVLKFDK